MPALKSSLAVVHQRKPRAVATVMVGERFARWTVLSPGLRSRGGLAARCRCECGEERVIPECRLKTGGSKSCGCYSADTSRKRKLTHGHGTRGARLPEYRVWEAMKRRCLRPTDKNYRNYGARGISVCERWLASFDAFLSDMGMRPSPDHQIDRVNNDGNYEPANCRWATRSEQCRNRRTTRLVEYQGRTQCVLSWCEELGLNFAVVRARLQLGWSAERAFLAPVRRWPRELAAREFGLLVHEVDAERDGQTDGESFRASLGRHC